MKLVIELKGSGKLKNQLDRLGRSGPEALGRALYREANQIMNVSKGIVPVDTGTLKRSGHVRLPEQTGNTVTVTMGYGGAASAYALVQHEELSYYHKPPTQAKYLEQPLNEAASGMAQRIAGQLGKELGDVAR